MLERSEANGLIQCMLFPCCFPLFMHLPHHVLLCCNGLKKSRGVGLGGVGWGKGSWGEGGPVGAPQIGERQSWINSGEESELIPQRAQMFAGLMSIQSIHLLTQPPPTDYPLPPPRQPSPPPHNRPETTPIKHSIKDVSQGAAWRNAV